MFISAWWLSSKIANFAKLTECRYQLILWLRCCLSLDMATWSGKVSKKTIFETNNTANIFYCLYPDDQQKIFYFFVRSTRFYYKRVILGFWILLLSCCNIADNFPVAVKYIFMYFHCYITFFFYLFFHFHLIFIRVRTCIWRRTEKKSKER